MRNEKMLPDTTTMHIDITKTAIRAQASVFFPKLSSLIYPIEKIAEGTPGERMTMLLHHVSGYLQWKRCCRDVVSHWKDSAM